LKKVILKDPEYWVSKAKGDISITEISNYYFTFKDFFKAFKVRRKKD
jgi:hypothetical protein